MILLKKNFAKSYELVNNGATEGEKQAAKAALERIIKTHKISADQLQETLHKTYTFKYTTNLELWLICEIICYFLSKQTLKEKVLRFPSSKSIKAEFIYTDYIIVECAYEYFRRHMKKQWKIVALPEIKKCKKK